MTQEKILIIDDNAINLKLERVLLTKEGYEVKTAHDGKEAIAVLENFKPRLILMDIQLPDVDGLELTKQFKSNDQLKDILIFAVTAYAMKGDQERAFAAGCDAYIPKPINIEYLSSLIQKAFSKDD